MLQGSSLTEFSIKYPERTIDTGIAEGHAVTFAGALATKGRPVVCSIYATFLQRAFDNLFHDVCLQESPVLFAIDRASLSAPDGSTHHGIYDLSFLLSMPNLVVCQPRDGQLLEELLETFLNEPLRHPTAIRYPNFETQKAALPLAPRQIGKGEVLQQGQELLIIALGTMNSTAREVAEKLQPLGIQATLLDPIFLHPFDSDLFEKLLLTHNKIVTIEEHSLAGGLGSLVNNLLVNSGINQINVINCGIPAVFPSHGSYKEILHEVGLSADQIFTKIIESFYSLHDHRPLCQSL
jgi:1-deoxy-D-xylulose-5-phosphate synthase